MNGEAEKFRRPRAYAVRVPGGDVFQGESGYMRWAPKVLLALGVVVLLVRWTDSLQWTSLLALVAYVHARWFAWRFVVSDDGVLLVFPFGRQAFIARESAMVKVETVGAVLRVNGRLLRYLLFDGILYRPGSEDALRAAFSTHGFRVTG
jgi:hypothetical protein